MQSHASQILGFKFQYYQRLEVPNSIPFGLYQLAALLVKEDLVDLDSMWVFLLGRAFMFCLCIFTCRVSLSASQFIWSPLLKSCSLIPLIYYSYKKKRMGKGKVYLWCLLVIVCSCNHIAIWSFKPFIFEQSQIFSFRVPNMQLGS